MPGGYDVDLGALGALIATIEQAADRMQAADGQLDKATTGDLGHPVINSAGEKFHDKWKYGIKQIRKHSKDTAEALDAARAGYAHAEQTNAGLQQLMLGVLGGQPSAPGSGTAP